MPRRGCPGSRSARSTRPPCSSGATLHGLHGIGRRRQPGEVGRGHRRRGGPGARPARRRERVVVQAPDGSTGCSPPGMPSCSPSAATRRPARARPRRGEAVDQPRCDEQRDRAASARGDRRWCRRLRAGPGIPGAGRRGSHDHRGLDRLLGRQEPFAADDRAGVRRRRHHRPHRDQVVNVRDPGRAARSPGDRGRRRRGRRRGARRHGPPPADPDVAWSPSGCRPAGTWSWTTG